MAVPAARRRKRLETTLAAAVAHPLRTRCLAIMAERVASPAEIGRELGVPVSKVGYHVAALADAGLIEEVRNRAVRGAIEHFYKAVELPCVDEDQEVDLAPAEQRTFAETVLSIYAANAAQAIETGSLFARTDHHLTRHALNVDEEGWAEMTAAYMGLYERVYEIQETAAERMGRSGERPVRVISFQSLFEAPERRLPG